MKFGVFSGFLGSGKTTSMMALTRYFTEHHGKAAMISNDLGGPGLADNRLAGLQGCNASELTGTCICYQTENLVARLDQLSDEGCTLVLSDIPGFGVGALDHVYHKLQSEYTGRYTLAPFTVLCEPKRVESMMEDGGGDLAYILDSQLREADLIVLNKCDTLTPEKKDTLLRFLGDRYPETTQIGISALTGDGLEELSQALLTGTASMRKPALGYGGTAFRSAMGQFSEYNIQYYAEVCCETFDGTAYLEELGKAIQQEILSEGGEIPHLKLLGWQPEGDYGKVDVLGVHRPLEVTKPFATPCRELAVVLNTSAMCKKDVLDHIMTDAVHRVSDTFQLTVAMYKKECFSAMGDDT